MHVHSRVNLHEPLFAGSPEYSKGRYYGGESNMKRLKPPCTEILKDKMNAKLDAGQRQKKKK